MNLSATQNVLRPDVIELTFGEPDPSLLPLQEVREATTLALERYGARMLAYGAEAGPEPLRTAVAGRIAQTEGVTLEPDKVVITAGNSQALDQVLTVFAGPGDVVLVEDPTYNLALGTIRDHHVEAIGIPRDADGLDVAALAGTVRTLRGQGRRIALLYVIATFHNPAGVSLSPARRDALVELARREDLLVVEDDVYRELAYDGPAPPSLWALDPAAPILRLGSFSKSLAPGMRTGWLNARRDLRERFVAASATVSGGCLSQFTGYVVASLLELGGYEDHVAALRRAYASRRDALRAALDGLLPKACFCPRPAGGFFLWLPLPPGLSATRLLPVAERHGVSFAPGVRFSPSGADDHARLAFSPYGGDELREGARRLTAALAELEGAG